MRSCICRAMLLVLPLTAVACAHYEAKPLTPERSLQQLRDRRLTDADVVAKVRAATSGRPQSVDSTLKSSVDGERAGSGSGTADAPAGAPITWGRAELLVAALELNPSLAEARAALTQAAASVQTAKALQNPSISLSNEYDVSRADESPWLWGIGTSFLLDTFVARKLRASLAQANVRGAHADFSEAIWKVRSDVRVALLALMIADKRITTLEADVAQRALLTKLAQARVNAGESARDETLQGDLELSRANTALDDARHARNEAQAKLAAAIGVSIAALAEVTPQWESLEAPAAMAPAVLEAPAGIPRAALEVPIAVTPAALDALREQALLSRPDLERALADYDAKELELRQQTSAQYLQASLGPGYTWDHGIRKVTFGASVSLPVFNRNEGPIAEALAARETAGAHALAVQASILNDIEAATQSYSASLSAIDRARSQRLTSESLAASAQRALAADATDRPTVVAAELNVSTARLAELDAIERAQQALGQLEDAVRAPLAGPEMNLGVLRAPGSAAADRPESP